MLWSFVEFLASAQCRIIIPLSNSKTCNMALFAYYSLKVCWLFAYDLHLCSCFCKFWLKKKQHIYVFSPKKRPTEGLAVYYPNKFYFSFLNPINWMKFSIITYCYEPCYAFLYVIHWMRPMESMILLHYTVYPFHQ